MKNVLFIGFVLFLTILSGLGVLWGANIYITEKNSKNWPTTTATVKESRIIESKGKYNVSYCPKWSYEFYINSKKYSSSRNAFGVYSCFNNRNEAEVELNSHPVNSKVKAIYNPENPSHAALKLSSSGSLYWMLIFVGGLCVFAGVMILTVLFKSTRNECVLIPNPLFKRDT